MVVASRRRALDLVANTDAHLAGVLQVGRLALMFFMLAAGLIGICGLIGGETRHGGTICSWIAGVTYVLVSLACDVAKCPYPDGQLCGIGAVLVVIAVSTVVWIATPRKSSLEYASYHPDRPASGGSAALPPGSDSDQARLTT